MADKITSLKKLLNNILTDVIAMPDGSQKDFLAGIQNASLINHSKQGLQSEVLSSPKLNDRCSSRKVSFGKPDLLKREV